MKSFFRNGLIACSVVISALLVGVLIDLAINGAISVIRDYPDYVYGGIVMILGVIWLVIFREVHLANIQNNDPDEIHSNI
jgi:hypothetical protein